MHALSAHTDAALDAAAQRRHGVCKTTIVYPIVLMRG